MTEENTNWCQSVAAVVISDGKVLLARHTYGAGNGLLIIPGGYVKYGESPQDALKREYLEEVNIHIEPEKIIAVRFNAKDWYIIFSAKYIAGTARSDHDENSEVVWLDIDEALNRSDVPNLTKQAIQCALQDRGLPELPYEGRNPPCSLYGNA